MADESEAEMGNQQGGGKKKKKSHIATVVTNGNGNGHVTDEDSEYKYVSIVDVNPSSFYETAGEESMCRRIEVNSPENTNGLSVKLNGKNGPESDVLKCSVVIGENVSENGHSQISRVSVNGSFDDSMGEPNGSSSFVEQESVNVPNVSAVKDSSDLPNGLPNGNSAPVLVPTVTISSKNSSPNSSLENGFSTPKGPDSMLISPQNGFLTPASRASPMEPISNGHHPSISMEEDLCSEEEVETLEERVARAVRQTLAGKDASGMDLGEDFQEEVERVVREKLKRQRSGSSDYWNHDDTDDHCIVDFLDKINDHAEARLAAKRQARAEAREIRMRELERMQRENEDGEKVYDIYSTPEAVNRCVRAGSVVTPRSLLSSNNSYHSSRRSSEDSLEEVNSIRDVRHELKELEEKFRKAMIANAQLDNEKAAFAYQVDLFKDKYEELEEQNLQLQRVHKETCRQLDQTKRHRTKLQEDLDITRTQLSELHQLIQEKGLVVVEGDCSSSDEESEGSQPRSQAQKRPKKALVSAEVADVIQQGSGSLDVRLKKFVEERNELMDELRRVKMELEEERARSRGKHTNGPTDDSEDIQREANKMLGDYKFKLQKAEQDVNTLQANVARLESQVVRYKSAAETSEKSEDELKLEKRKLQRELRETQARLEELETSNSHLQRRLDKLKNAKSALLKDL